MGSDKEACFRSTSVTRPCAVHSVHSHSDSHHTHSSDTTCPLQNTMDLYTLVPRTLVGVVYPAFASLKAVLHGSPESAGAWLRYWVVLGVFSLVELFLDPFINPISYSFPTYLVVKCLFLVWCMLPVSWNGSDILFNQVLFPLFKEHHQEIEEQAEKAKQSLKEKFGDFFKNDKNGKTNVNGNALKENGKHETRDKIENFFKSKDKPVDEKSLKQN